MPNFGGGGFIIVVAPIVIAYRRIDQLAGIEVIQTGKPHGIECSTGFGIAPTEGAHTAMSAKNVMDAVRLVIVEI